MAKNRWGKTGRRWGKMGFRWGKMGRLIWLNAVKLQNWVFKPNFKKCKKVIKIT